MTITLNLAPEDEAQLSGIAARQGQDAAQVAYSLFASALAQVTGEREVRAVLVSMEDSLAERARPLTEWDAEFRAKYNIPANLEPLSDEELRAMDPEDEGEAISLGLDDSFAGRVTSAPEWSAKFRAQHNIPEGGRPMSHEDAKRVP